MSPAMPLRRLASIALLCLATGAQAAPPLLPLPADWYPESVAVGPDGSFYVGSWRQGAVARLKAGSPPAVLVKPGSNGLANTQGVLVDAKRGTLWVCSGNIGFTLVPPTPSALKRYDLATGAARGSYTMPDAGYCNDLAQDTRGNIYVTDSLHPRVLRLPPGADALMPWKDDALLAGPAPYGDFKGLNGIAFDGDRHLVVSLVAAASHVLRIDIDTQGRAGTVTRIEAPRELKNVDAIRAWRNRRPANWPICSLPKTLSNARDEAKTLPAFSRTNSIRRPPISSMFPTGNIRQCSRAS